MFDDLSKPKRVAFELRISIVPKGRQQIAWGVSPRNLDHTGPKPRRGDTTGSLMFLSPLWGFEFVWVRIPGAYAPGYLVLPLRG